MSEQNPSIVFVSDETFGGMHNNTANQNFPVDSQQSQTPGQKNLASSVQPTLPDHMCQFIAQRYLQQFKIGGSGELDPSIARKMAFAYLEQQGYQQQNTPNSSQISLGISLQQTMHYENCPPEHQSTFQAQTNSLVPSPEDFVTYLDDISANIFPLDYGMNDTEFAKAPEEAVFQNPCADGIQAGSSVIQSNMVHGNNGINEDPFHFISFESEESSRISAFTVNSGNETSFQTASDSTISSLADSSGNCPIINAISTRLESEYPFQAPNSLAVSLTPDDRADRAAQISQPSSSLPIAHASSIPQTLSDEDHTQFIVPNLLGSTISANMHATSELNTSIIARKIQQSKRKSESSQSGKRNRSFNQHISQKACLNCRNKRLKCNDRNSSEPCENCKQIFKLFCPSPKIAMFICQDYNEKMIDFRKSIDFFCLDGRSIIPFIPNGNTIQLELAHPLQIIGQRIVQVKNAPKLLVQAEEGEIDRLLVNGDLMVTYMNGIDMIGVEKATARVTSQYLDFYRTREVGIAYRLVESTLPSYEDLINWARYDIPLKAHLVPESMEYALDNFLDKYITHVSELPMHQLAKLVLETACLARFLDDREPVISEKSQKALSYISESSPYLSIGRLRKWRKYSEVGVNVHYQFVFWVAKGIEIRELKILSEFDSYEKNPENPFVLFACVQRMMLFYRRRREYYHNLRLPDRTRTPEILANALARRLYHLSDRIFFQDRKIQSPFSDCLNRERRSAFNNDEDLIAQFEKLSFAEPYFLQECEQNEYDNVYVGLHGQMKDKRKHRGKKDKGKKAVFEESSNSNGSSSPATLVSTNTSSDSKLGYHPDYCMWTLLKTFGPPPPPPSPSPNA